MNNLKNQNENDEKNKNSKKYEYLEHTADVKFRAYGKTLEEQFANASLAMYNVLTDTTKVKGKINKSISTSGNDLKALLYNFLEEFLFLIDSEQFMLNSITNININRMNSKYIITALISGDKLDAGNYQTHGDIKAITYAEMEITEEYIQVVLDI